MYKMFLIRSLTIYDTSIYEHNMSSGRTHSYHDTLKLLSEVVMHAEYQVNAVHFW